MLTPFYSGAAQSGTARLRVLGYAADSDEQALRDAGAREILRSIDELPQLVLPGREPASA